MDATLFQSHRFCEDCQLNLYIRTMFKAGRSNLKPNTTDCFGQPPEIFGEKKLWAASQKRSVGKLRTWFPALAPPLKSLSSSKLVYAFTIRPGWAIRGQRFLKIEYNWISILKPVKQQPISYTSGIRCPRRLKSHPPAIT